MIERFLRHRSSNDDTYMQVPDLTIAHYDPPNDTKLHPVPVSNEQLSALNTLLKLVPAAIHGAQSLNQTYLLTFAPDIAHKIRIGTYTLMEASGSVRGVVIDAHGKIVAHGTLVAATGVQLSTVALVSWQVLAIVTAQHYLPQIVKSLATIEQGISAIQIWLETQEKARLIRDLNRLRESVAICATSPLSKADAAFQRHQLEQVYSDVDQIAEATALRLAEHYRQLAGVDPHNWFGAEDVKQDLLKQLQTCESTGTTYLLALIAKTLAAGQLALLEFDVPIQRQRLAHIVDALAPARDYTSAYTKLVIEKYKGLGGPVDPWGSDNARREAIAKQINQTRERINTSIDHVLHCMTYMVNQLDQQTLLAQSGSWVLTTDAKGQIAQVYAYSAHATVTPVQTR